MLAHSISVFAVGVGSAFFDRKFERLSEYAHATGGDIYYAASEDAMQDLYSRVTEEARNEYTLGYIPQGFKGVQNSKDYHTVEVRVERQGMTILTRNRYYTGGVTQ